jgi:death on curing protein
MTIYPTKAQLLEFHKLLIERYGGSIGIRDEGLLESALARPQQTFGGEDLYPDMYSKTAALMESLCKNHPFLDGNKRIAFAGAVAFLKTNNIHIKCNTGEGEKFVLSIAEGKKGPDDIVTFLKDHTI